MADYKELYDYLMKALSLKTPPVAVKYFKEMDEDEVWDLADQEVYRPKAPLNLCQLIGQARYHLKKTIVTDEDHVCNIGALGASVEPFDEDMQNGEIGKKDGVRSNDELIKEMFQTLPRIPEGEVAAIGFSPLDKMDLEADQLIIYGDPLQILRVMNGVLYDTAARMQITTCGKYGVCVEGMAAAYTTGKAAVSFPCRGERVSSIVQDNEMSITVPMKDMERVVEGIEKTKHLLPKPIPFGGVDQEPNFLPDYYLTENALKRRA
jgi:uncharacterized protein (DUF169 family)